MVGEKVKLVDAGQTGHRAHHCTTRKPPMTGHGRWYTHTRIFGYTLTVHALIAREESLTHALSLPHTHAHSHSAASST